MKIVTTVPPGLTLVREYGPSTVFDQVAADIALVKKCGREPVLVAGAGYALWLEPTEEEETLAIAREQHPHQIERRPSLAELDDALEPCDPLSRGEHDGPPAGRGGVFRAIERVAERAEP